VLSKPHSRHSVICKNADPDRCSLPSQRGILFPPKNGNSPHGWCTRNRGDEDRFLDIDTDCRSRLPFSAWQLGPWVSLHSSSLPFFRSGFPKGRDRMSLPCVVCSSFVCGAHTDEKREDRRLVSLRSLVVALIGQKRVASFVL
jgi:hypothetical protein